MAERAKERGRSSLIELNRAVARLTLFEKQEDYEAFERVLKLAHERVPLPIFGYCVVPNHWHFVVQPKT